MIKMNLVFAYISVLGISVLAALAANGCATNVKLPDAPRTPRPFRLYNIPKEIIGNVMPDEIAKGILQKYTDPSWIDKPWVYMFSSGYGTPRKIATNFRNMKILIPHYGYRYQWFQPRKRFSTTPDCCLFQAVFIRDANFFHAIKEIKKCAAAPPEYSGVSNLLNCEKFKFCVFVVGAENEYQMNYRDSYAGLKIICGRNIKERDEILKALIALQVRY